MADSTAASTAERLDDRIGPWLAIYLKGLFMGAADTVPGVSGGTIALITGIYDRLIAAITALDPRLLGHLPHLHRSAGRDALVADLRALDVPFLVVLVAGIGSAVVALASGMHVAVTEFPVPTYAFFAGLIAASAVVLYRYVAVDTPARVAVALVGFALAFVVSGVGTAGAGAAGEPSVGFVFAAGAVAITAMVLPGVSGAFILVLLGLYEFMSAIPGAFVAALLAAVTEGEVGGLADPGVPLVAFLGGAIIGVLTVAHAVRWALDHYHEATLAFLVALMAGGLRAPLRTILAAGDGRFTPALVALAIVTGLVGALLVLALDRYTDDLQY